MNKKYGLLFPGQGSQKIGMGKDLYENDPHAKWVFDRANEVLGKDIAKLCFEGPAEELETTLNSQPAIFVTSIAVLVTLLGKLVTPSLRGVAEGHDEAISTTLHASRFTINVQNLASLAMGLSLGEPTALVASGALTFEDGLKFVAKRGEYMDEASRKEPGKMASIIGLELEKVENICKGVGCQVANLNSPGQIVISGKADRVELACDLAKTNGAGRTIMLKVSGAFHSVLMKSAKEKLKSVLDTITIKEPAVDFISNIDAELTRDPARIKENLINQLDNRTLWEASMRKAASLGITDFLELGPGTVLKSLAQRIDSSLNVTSLGTLSDIIDKVHHL